MCVVCLLVIVTCGRTRGGTLLGNTTRRSLTVRRVDGEINVLFRGCSHVERRNVHQLRSHTNVTLSDQNTGVVDRLGQTLLVHLGLETALQQLLSRQLQHSIQLEFVVRQQTIPVHTTQQGGTLKDSLGVLGVEREQGSGRLTELGQSVLHAPNLALAAEPIFSNELEFGIQTFFFVRPTGSLEFLAVCKE